MTPETLAARNRAASLARHRGPDHATTRQAYQYLAYLMLAERIDAASLSAEHRSRLAAQLLSGGAR